MPFTYLDIISSPDTGPVLKMQVFRQLFEVLYTALVENTSPRFYRGLAGIE
jgi:hypothetical protein